MIGSALRGPLQGLRTLAGRLSSDRRGNVVMMFAFALPVLLMITFAGIDISRITMVKARMQDALDAAALAAARSTYTDAAQLKTVALIALKANLRNAAIEPFNDDDFTISLTKDQVVIADAKVQVKTLVANIVLPPYGKILDDTLPLSAHSEVNRSSKDIEVALVLDITGSMTTAKLKSLKDASAELVDIVVQTKQTPYYSKMSIVPYSMGVNLGATYATGARGTPIGSKAITSIVWSSGSAITVTAATKATPISLTTSTNHGFSVGDKVAFWNVSGMTNLNGVVYTVASVPTTKTFTLKNAANTANVDSRNWSSLNTSSSTPYVAKCARTDCKPTVTSTNHGLGSPSGSVYLTGVGGMTDLNNKGFLTTYLTPNTYLLETVGSQVYSSGGTAYCGQEGCQWRVFTSATGAVQWLANSNCVSERTGSDAYTDAAPGSSRVGFNYPASNNGCPAAAILPLSSNTSTLKSLISSLSAGGSTAGQIGAAWGWYTVSPNFGSLWSGSAAAPYDVNKTLKAVILMTDGEFNTPYNTGVISKDAGTGSGNDSDHINQNATNGDSFSQALSLCAAMKKQGIIVYTVGFQVASQGDAAQLMTNCATSPSYAYLPTSSTDLSEAFKAIGRDITRLRISR